MKLLGNRTAFENFKRELLEGKLSHAFIIEGARGSGRLTLARHLSALLMCERGALADCSCKGCRRALEGAHPDVHELIHLDRTGQIKIDDIRAIISEAHVKPSEADYKVFIIENAQMMNKAAQNALLQIFEEPPQNTVFFLLTTDRNLLLKTLLSRARVIMTERLSHETVEGFLEEKYPDKKELIKRAVRLSSGFVGDAAELCENEASEEALTLVTDYFEAVSKGADFYSLSRLLSPFARTSREEFSCIIGYFIPALRDTALACLDLDGDYCFFTDASVPELVSRRLGLSRTLRAFEFCTDLQKRQGSMNFTANAAMLNTYFASDIK